MTQESRHIEVETAANPDATLIWLHGLGADGNDFVPVVPELRVCAHKALRFIFPHAPVQPVTVNAGMRMRAWYDITGLGAGYTDDEHGIRESEQILCGLIAREQARGIASNRIVLAGFSQGGAVALHTGLRFAAPLAGIMALSTYLPLADKLFAERHEDNHEVPIFIAHGSDDTVVPIAYARQTFQKLYELDYAPEWHQYPMAHSLCAQELHDISEWLDRVL